MINGLNLRFYFKALGLLSQFFGGMMFIPAFVGYYYGEPEVAYIFIRSSFIPFFFGLSTYFTFRDASPQVGIKDSLLLVTSTWLLFIFYASIPFYLTLSTATFVDAWFESASGFTTTGASVITDIEALPHAILIWRSLIAYLGGMGIVVLSLAVLPLLGVGGMDLYKAESPGPKSDKISAKVGETARSLWLVYLSFAGAEAVLLWFYGMSMFDAINHAMTTVATSGFSTKNNSIAYFDSAAIDYIISFFMFIAGISFALHFRLLLKRSISFLADSEFRFYVLQTFLMILLFSACLHYRQYDSFWDSLRYSVFQITAISSSTGFGTADYLLWGDFLQFLIICLMVTGGCAGSTAGGIKCVRSMILLKQGMKELKQLLHPNAVISLKLGKVSIPSNMAKAIFGFFFLYMFLFALGSLLLCANGLDILTACSAIISALSNIGPGLGEVGPANNYSGLPDLSKLVLSFCMVIGRLEILTVLVIFTPSFWKS